MMLECTLFTQRTITYYKIVAAISNRHIHINKE